ncbi:FAD linked oxidase-like protein [Rubrobacter xylanophilus DSM 9941]|uniref:FAD linked oxidase-like protein n=1 Tax=Rubrobacter xylanophilus (strain DSM 9941 / JCM 11954 / NBRC 16129 / PRD-1) TaxID=266117 RepID=Q1ARI4_RUBXD|nr:LLM class flavin-dependent oxidoreductase [Rubrobacter xylanophilus]ABG05994.1 FAD linked oxidase-like protein [Rubrobacter xylanophilus DSM 9941]
MSYGHSLEFGALIAPAGGSPEAAVALARRAEELGYDLVTFGEPPGGPAPLDAWTLMSWVAGRTRRVRIGANALRADALRVSPGSPAVLARAAASLDLLSGGRLELGLSPGDSFGGAPGEAAALGEAVDVIRGLLDAGERGPLRFDGEHHRVRGAGRGPAPERYVPIYVEAHEPEHLRLAGRKADGWLATLGEIKAAEIRAANGLLDEAAWEAGRDPREVRRLLNVSGRFSASRGGLLEGPAEKWVEDLLPLVTEDGIGTLVLLPEDEEALERFALEVAPELREAAGRRLAGAAPGGGARPLWVRSRRHPGIDYDGIPAPLRENAVEPGDPAYARLRSTYLRGGAPGLILRAQSAEQVAGALAFARSHPGVPLGIRSGGHGISGRSTNRGGIVIDLSRMNGIEVLDEAARRVRLGPGARWTDVAAALAPYGWGLSSGDYGGVGVGGLATAGGIGWLARGRGLTIDHLRAVEVVLADGSVVRASGEENPDLFWAVRGAGANFGVVVSFEFEAYEVGEVGWGRFLMDASDTAGLLRRWGAAVEAAPRELTSFIILGAQRPGRPAVAQVLAVVDSDRPETIVELLEPVAGAAPVYDQSVVITPYASIMANAQGSYHEARGEPVARSGLVRHITPRLAAAAEALLRSGAAYFFQIRSVGGAVADVAPGATAYANRSANFHVTAFGASGERLDAAWEAMRPDFDGLYLSFDTDRRPERLREAFPPATLARLRELKARYDPGNLFDDNFNIPPAERRRA